MIRARIEVYRLDISAVPGNSGSPVYDPATGEVVGIVNSVFVRRLKKENAVIRPTGITYAIPPEYLRELLARNGQAPGPRYWAGVGDAVNRSRQQSHAVYGVA